MKLFVSALAVVAVAFILSEQLTANSRIEVVAVETIRITPSPPLGRTGDHEAAHWSIRDRRGRTIGIGHFDCRWHSALRRLCYGEIRLPLGKLSFVGASQTRSRGIYAVVGGTERYLGASGEMTFRSTGIDRLTLTITI